MKREPRGWANVNIYVIDNSTTMKIRILLLILLVTSCTDKPAILPDCFTAKGEFIPEECPTKGNCSFEYYPDSKIIVTDDSLSSWMEVVDGDFLVFMFKYKKNDNPMIMDDEYEEYIWFEVQPEGDSFLITGDQLRNAGAMFGRMCFCADGGYHRITEGCIYGYRKSDKTWNISLRLTTVTNVSTYERMKQHDFTRTTRNP